MKMRAFDGDLRRGFTLLELIAVVAIISVLVALLVPMFKNMRQKSAAVECLSNLRNLAVPFEMYSQEHHGDILPRFVRGPGFWYSSTSPLVPYVSSEAVLLKLSVCPLNRTRNPLPPPVDNDAGYPYIANHYLMPAVNMPARKRLSISHPAKRILLADSHAGSDWTSGFLPGSYPGVIAFQHVNHANVLFLDGHVGSLAMDEITEEMVLVPY